MKKYIILTAITLILTSCTLLTGITAIASVPLVTLTTPQEKSYTDQLFASGMTEEVQKKEVILDFPIVPAEVFVEVGDYVKAGQAIATIDWNATRQAVSTIAGQYLDSIPTEVMAALNSFDLSVLDSTAGLPTQIFTTASGTITTCTLIAGNLSLPQTSAATVSQLDRMQARFYLSENDAAKVQPGGTVYFTTPAIEGGRFSGKILRVSPTAYPRYSGFSSETVVDVTVKIDDDFDVLRPGYTLSGKLSVGTPRNLLLLPYEAIAQDDNGQEFVYLYDNGCAVRWDIETATELSTAVEVVGVSAGEPVIANAQAIQAPGKVRLKNS